MSWQDFFTIKLTEGYTLAVEDLAQQLDVSPAQFDACDWHGRAGKAQRSAIRAWLGFRRATEADATDLLAWLRWEMLPPGPDEAHVQDDALAWDRARRIEPAPPYRRSSSGGANSGDLKTVLAMCMKARAGSTPI